jgi:hypothetical protein
MINTRFAYVSVSRASHDAQIYTNDAVSLGQRLSTHVTKNSAIDFQKAPAEPATIQHDQVPTMSHSKKQAEPLQETMSLPHESSRQSRNSEQSLGI